MRRLKYLLLTIFMTLTIPVYANEIDIKSNNAVLYNLEENRILYEKNKDQKVSIASLTKLMTALVAVENIDNLNEKVKFEKSDYEKLAKQDASPSSLDYNKEYTYEDLLYGLLLESGADCANALARLTAGSEQSFVNMMNIKAKQIGMNNTSFANPIGLDDKKNYSTVNDVAILLKEDLSNEILKPIITSLHHTLTDGTKINHTIYSYMKTYKIDIPTMIGGKTGYELKSGYALASIAKKDNTTLMLITSKAKERPDHIKDAQKIYNYYFNTYSYIPVIKKGQSLVTINTKYLSANKINIKADQDITYYTNKNFNPNDITTEYEGKTTLTLNDRYNENLGNLKIYYQGKQIMNYQLVLNENIYPNPSIVISIIIILSSITLLITIKRKK